MRYRNIMMVASSLFLLGSAQAGTMGPIATDPNEWVVTLGGFGINQGEAQHIDIATLIGNTYTVTKHNDGGFLVGLGYFRSLPSNTYPVKVGVNAYYLTPTSVKGEVVQEDLFTNLSYSYKVTHVPVYAMLKTELTTPLVPVNFNVGIGPNFQITQKYAENSLDGITLTDDTFKGSTKATFSATAGVSATLGQVLGKGIDCGYQFMYLGHGELKQNNDQIVNSLKTGPAYANVGFCAVKF